MSAARPPAFEDFLGTLQQLTSPLGPIDPGARQPYKDAARALQALARVDHEALTELIAANPEWVPILGSVVGMSQEQLKNVLRHRLGTSGWVRLARERPDELVALLENDYGLSNQLEIERGRDWSYGDILFERVTSRSRAGRAIGRGRSLEDEVEAVVKSLGLSYTLRTQFTGRSGRPAPCDLAVPEGGAAALIVCAVKGFNSTGSKLTDAVREVEAMAEVRDANQFVYAIVDGIGWLSRQSDLRRIHTLWTQRAINGVFSLAQLSDFWAELERAATIHELR